MATEEMTENEKILKAINDTLLNRATTDQQNYMIGTRQLSRIPLEELRKLKSTYTTAVRLERNKAFGTVKIV